MAPKNKTNVKQRLGAGLLFLVIAMAVLVTRPADTLAVAIIASVNLLISAGFLLTVGRDTTEDDTYDMGFWILSMTVASLMYIGTEYFFTNSIYITKFLVFIIGFGIILGFLAYIRGIKIGK